ncbi:MAG TPA: hypothetical protein VJ695_06170 [Nitrososphaera sp.]|nr:hypothetical protein [Nitrososphaera sp.]
MNTIFTRFVAVSLLVIIVGVGTILTIVPAIYAQENLSSSLQHNSTTIGENNNTSSVEEKTYILIFGQRTVGNIDNSTRIVSSVVGDNPVKIQEEFLEEISLAPSRQLEQQINKIVNDGVNGSPCGGENSLTTQQGENVSVQCVSSGNTVIWYIYPTS